MSVKTPDTKDQQDTAYNPSEQHYDEQFNRDYVSKGLKDLEDHANSAGSEGDDANTGISKNIDDTKQQEEGWRNNFTGKNNADSGKDAQKGAGGAAAAGAGAGGMKQVAGRMMGLAKRQGPLGLIIGLLSVLGLLGSGTFLSGLGLINFKELLVEKFDSMTSVVEERADLALGLRLFGENPTSKTCAVMIKCRFKGLSERQMQRLKVQGAQLVDANGKEVTKNPITRRYSGGQKLIYTRQVGGQQVKETIDASKFKLAVRDKSYSDLRTLVRSVYAPRYMSWNDSVAKDIRSKKRLVSNPQWGEEGDQKSANKEVAKAVAGESPGATATENTKYTTDEHGNQVPVQEDPSAQGLDFGDDTKNINDEKDKLLQQAANGDITKSLPDDVATVATLPEYEGKYSGSGIKSVIGALNPLDAVAGLCTIYQLANVTLVTAKTIALANAMRYASQFMSTADMFKALDGTPDSMEKAMTILQKENQYGDSYGDSFTYNYIAYNTVTDIPLGSSAGGNDTIRTISTAINTVNGALGGKSFVSGACNVLTNPFVQGLLALTSFIPGAGQLSGSLAKILTKGGMDVAKNAIKDKIKSLIEATVKNLTKDKLKDAAKSARDQLFKLAKDPAMALFLGGYLFERYGVPYIAQTLAGTEFVGADGMKAADGIGNGFDATNSATAQLRALTPLNKEQYKSFVGFQNESTTRYVADMQQETSPLDFTSPYSAGSRVASATYPLLSKLDIFSHPSDILSLPSTILSSLSPNKLLSQTSYAATTDINAELSYCQDDFLQQHNLATSPYCNVKYGFNDLNMLNNTDPDAVINWMLDNKEIDNDGNPIPDSDFADFKSKCVDGTENKFISDIGDEEQHIDEECYGDKNNSTNYKMYRLYIIDTSVADGMDDVQNNTNSTASAAPEECKTMAADDLGQIACHAYQFDPYGYKWGGGHGETTAAAFMQSFKANQFTPGQDHILDCSGLVRMAIFDATGVDIGGMPTGGYPTYSKFKEVSKQEAKAGDILWRDGHTEIVVSNDPNSQTWKTFGAHQVYSDIAKDIGPASYSYSGFTKVFRFTK